MLAGAPLLLQATVIKTGRSGRNHWNSQVWELNKRFEICYYDFSHEENKSNPCEFELLHHSQLLSVWESNPLKVWYFHTQALWSFIVVFDSTVTVRLHVALPQRQLSKALLSQLWVTQTASGTQKSAVLMMPRLFAIQMRSVLQTDSKWKEWKVFSLESSLCLTAHTMLPGRKSQKMSWTSKWKAGVLLT